MGLIRKAFGAVKGAANSATGGAVGALGGVLHQAIHQEYFASGAMTNDIIMRRAEQIRPNGSTNTNSDANVITNGSLIDVQSNQCMIIVENGRVVEACMEPGQFVYDTTLAPSFFSGEGSFGDRFKSVAKEVWEQAKMGGQRRSTQRIYFINTGILDKSLQWGVGNVSFKHTQRFAGMPAPLVCTVHVKGFGTARVRMTRPLDFYENYGAKYAGGDNDAVISLTSLDTFFENTRHKMSQAVSTAMAEIGSRAEVTYDQIMVGENMTLLANLATKQLEGSDLYRIGFDCYDFTVGGSGLVISKEDEEMISTRQNQMMMLANGAANYDIQTKMAEGFAKGAEKGGIPSMMGMGMFMGGMGGMGMGNIGQSQPAYNPMYDHTAPVQQPQPMQGVAFGGQPAQPQAAAPAPAVPTQEGAAEAGWTCTCGAAATGNFCPQCGSKKPAPVAAEGWTCSCGKVNTGNFCSECGSKKPEKKKKMVCDKCGWTSEDLNIRFCPNCGDPVNEADFQ